MRAAYALLIIILVLNTIPLEDGVFLYKSISRETVTILVRKYGFGNLEEKNVCNVVSSCVATCMVGH